MGKCLQSSQDVLLVLLLLYNAHALLDHVDELNARDGLDLDVGVQLAEELQAGVGAGDLADVLLLAVEVGSEVLYLDQLVVE